MHECKRSQCAVWVKNSKLLTGGNVRELNIDEQFSKIRVEE